VVDLAALRFWEAPELTSLGRLPMRSPLEPADSPWVRSLDGPWRFRLLRSPLEVPPDVGDGGFDDGSWDEVDVPSLWTMQPGSPDLPRYTNVQMPFDGAPPAVPEENPTGCYRRRFEVPGEWDGRRVVLQVGAAESALAVVVNGRLVGISKDSHLAAEFDVTDAVDRAGLNVVALVVVKWSDASWIEDQDQWWHGGLSRSVLLRSVGPVHVADVKATTTLDAVDVRVEVGGEVAEGWSARIAVQTLGDEVLAGRRGPFRSPGASGSPATSCGPGSTAPTPSRGRPRCRRSTGWSSSWSTRRVRRSRRWRCGSGSAPSRSGIVSCCSTASPCSSGA
jgi:hypothetical protein